MRVTDANEQDERREQGVEKSDRANNERLPRPSNEICSYCAK